MSSRSAGFQRRLCLVRRLHPLWRRPPSLLCRGFPIRPAPRLLDALPTGSPRHSRLGGLRYGTFPWPTHEFASAIWADCHHGLGAVGAKCAFVSAYVGFISPVQLTAALFTGFLHF